MKKVLLTSVLGLSAAASVAHAATEVPSIPGVTAPATPTYQAKPISGTDGKPLNDATREFGNNTRFGAGFNK